MTCVGEQADAVAHEACDGLDDDEKQVERYRYNIYCRQLLYRVRVMVVVTVMVVAMLMMVAADTSRKPASRTRHKRGKAERPADPYAPSPDPAPRSPG